MNFDSGRINGQENDGDNIWYCRGHYLEGKVLVWWNDVVIALLRWGQDIICLRAI